MAFVRLSPAEFTSAGRAASLKDFEPIDRDRIDEREVPPASRGRQKTAEPAIEADLEWDEQRPA